MSNPGFCDESEQKISDHHESESSDEIAEENEISTSSGAPEAMEGDVEEVFQELAMKLVNKILQLRGPEITLCQQTDHLLNHRLVQHIDIPQAVGRIFLCIVYR